MSDVLNTHEDDPCCGKRISKALREGELEGKCAWICPRCGQEWLAEEKEFALLGNVLIGRHWQPHSPIAVIRG